MQRCEISFRLLGREMSNRSYCCRAEPMPATRVRVSVTVFIAVLCGLAATPRAAAGDAPQWMHAVVSAPLPAHDEKTDAVLLYAENNINVVSTEKIKTPVRRVYKILRPAGREKGWVAVSFNAHRKITGLRGWCIPAQGKDYEIKDKEAIEIALPKIEGSELISDVKEKMLRIPAPDPGNVVGYEYAEEEQPMVLQDIWMLQAEIPGRERHYSLQLPAGWEYKASWINYLEAKPTQAGANHWEWVITDVKGIRK